MANDYVGWGLILGIEDSLDDFINDATEVVNSLGTGLPPRDLAAFSSQSTESGIQLTFTPPAQTYIDDGGTDQFAVMPAGVLIRYSDTGYPRTPDEGVFGYDYKPTGDWVTTSQTCTIVGLTKDTKYYFTAFPYSTEHVYNKNQVTANRTEMTWVGNKGTISVTVNTPEGYEGTLGEYTITLVDQAESGGQNVEKTATGAGLTQFGGLEGGKTYKVRLSNTSDLQAPPDSEVITIVGGVNYNVTMTYALMYGTITVNVSTQPAGMPIGAYTVTLTPNDSSGALQQSGNNSQAVVFSNVKNGVVYTVGLSSINHYTANAGGTVTAVGGQNTQHNAQYVFSATLDDLSWAEIHNLLQQGRGTLFSVGDRKSTSIGQLEGDWTYWGDASVARQISADAILVNLTSTRMTFILDKYMYAKLDDGFMRYTSVHEWPYEHFASTSELLPECHSYLVLTSQTWEELIYERTLTGYIVAPTRNSVTGGFSYFTSNSRRKISDGAYRLLDRDGESSPADDWNYYVTSSGSIKSYESHFDQENAGGAAIFTIG